MIIPPVVPELSLKGVDESFLRMKHLIFNSLVLKHMLQKVIVSEWIGQVSQTSGKSKKIQLFSALLGNSRSWSKYSRLSVKGSILCHPRNSSLAYYFKLANFKKWQTWEKLWKPNRNDPFVRVIYMEICKGSAWLCWERWIKIFRNCYQWRQHGLYSCLL